MYNVEITCTPSLSSDKDLAMKEFYDFLVNRKEEVVGMTVGILLHLGIKTVDLIYCVKTTSRDEEKLFITASLNGRGISNGHYDFEYIKERITEILTKEFSFKPGELSLNIYLNKINLLTYWIEFLKGCYKSTKRTVLNIELTS